MSSPGIHPWASHLFVIYGMQMVKTAIVGKGQRLSGHAAAPEHPIQSIIHDERGCPNDALGDSPFLQTSCFFAQMFLNIFLNCNRFWEACGIGSG